MYNLGVITFLASRLQSASLETKLLQHSGIVAYGPAFDDAFYVFNMKMKTNLLSNPSEIAALKLIKKLEDIYSHVLLKQQNPLFLYHLNRWLCGNLKWRITLLIGLGWCPPIFCFEAVLSLLQSLFGGYLWRPCCIMCRYGIKHRHNVVHDTLVDICFRSGISAGKEVDIGLGRGCDKPLRPADMLLYSWDVRLDMCVDLIGSLPLTQTGMVDFVPGRAVIDAAHRKQVKYEAKCADIGYGFLPFSFSSLRELEKDAVTLLKQI
ncbi:hypothetical protein Tco_1540880 [Tanacetum coccineum]